MATQPLVIPSRPHSIRMGLETALAGECRRARVAMTIDRIPALPDLVRQRGVFAVPALNAIGASGHEAANTVSAIGPPPLQTPLWIATSEQRPLCPLIEQSTTLVQELRVTLWR